MLITVRFFGPFEEYSDTRERCLDIPEGATVEDALNALGVELGQLFREEVLGQSDKVRHMVLVNGASLFARGWMTRLSDGDTISLAAPTAGG